MINNEQLTVDEMTAILELLRDQIDSSKYTLAYDSVDVRETYAAADYLGELAVAIHRIERNDWDQLLVEFVYKEIEEYFDLDTEQKGPKLREFQATGRALLKAITE